MRKAVLAILILATAGSCYAKYSGGTGEPNTPYQIATKADLLALAANRADYGKYFILTADIDLEGQVFTAAIIAADGGPSFSGTFNGNDHKITHSTITGGDSLGLFGQIGSGGSVKNLGLDNFTVSSFSSDDFYGAGCLVGWNCGTISNCSSTGSVSGSQWVGGLVGENLGGTISNCYSTDSVSGTSDVGGLVGVNSGTISNCHSTGLVSGTSGVGGLVGGGGGTISNCYSTGNVNGTSDVGGLMGANSGTISNCYSTGSVSGSYGLGGLVGNHSGGILKNCYSTGDVNGGDNSHYLGGLAGFNGNDINNCYSTGNVNGGDNSYCLGGLVGLNTYSNISNCYSTGAVTGRDSSYYLGGLVGRNFYANISSSYFLDTAGLNNGYGAPLTDAQMKQQASFVGWDFNNVWHICETTNYPKLIWQIPQADFLCPDGVNFADYGFFANWWGAENCAANNDCDGADLTGDGRVDSDDLAALAEEWLTNEE